MIKESYYKDRPAISVQCDKFVALFLPYDGAKMVSFKSTDGEEFLAQAPGEKYLRLDIDGDYAKSECSAFDDMFPTIDPCVINGMEYLDHGQVCRIEHKYIIQNNSVTFICEMDNLNIKFIKTVSCKNDKLNISYRIENNNNFVFPYLWAGHMMFKGQEGAYVVSEFLCNSPKKVMFGRPKIEQQAHILETKGNKHYKFYYTEAKAPIVCGIVYPESKKEISVRFDNQIVKYLGLWMNPEDFNGMYNIALEPCTALFDNPINAKKANAESYIDAKNCVEFILELDYKENSL